MYIDCPGNSTDAVARHVSFAQITCTIITITIITMYELTTSPEDFFFAELLLLVV